MFERKPRYRHARLTTGREATSAVAANKPHLQILLIFFHQLVSTYLVDTSCTRVLNCKRCGDIRAYGPMAATND